MRGVVCWVLVVLGAALLTLAVPVGYVNRTVLDAPTFADRVDDLRLRADVRDALGRDLSRQLIRQNPDLVAIAPLVDQVAIGVVGSDMLSGPVKLAASQFHRALTTENSGQLVLRVADAGAVVAGAIGALAPERAPSASDVGVTLANLGNQGFAASIVRYVDLIDTFAWLLPLLGVAFLVASVLLHPDRWAASRRVGWALLIAAAALAGGIVLAGVAVRAGGADQRRDALLDGAWDIFVRPIWWSLGFFAGFAVLILAAGSGRAAEWDVAGSTRRVSDYVTAVPASTRGVAVKALVFISAGVALLVEPAGTVTLLAFAAGAVLIAFGISAIASLAPTPGPDAGRIRSSQAHLASIATVGIVGVVALAAFVVWAARPPDRVPVGVAAGAIVGEGVVCNGHEELCERRFDEVSYAATHNSMAVAGKPGWYIAEQGLDIIPQLDFGVRALLIDVWYGRAAGAGRVRTSARSYEEALAITNEALGPDVLKAALRVIDAVAPGEPHGEEALYMCHGLCETGATSFDDTLVDIRAWLATHPDEVMTIFIEDHVDAADVGAAVIDAGLVDYLYTPLAGEPFPTLGDMIRSGRRLVVMLETDDGRPEYPWLVNGFDFVQETPYTFPTVESFSCEPNRGVADAPLLQINHWLARFTSLVSDARLVNAADVLGPRVFQCEEERGMQPTFVAVNYADIGDLIAVVDRLNAVG